MTNTGIGIRSFNWSWANGWGLHHYIATDPQEMANAVSRLASSLAEILEGKIGVKKAIDIANRGKIIAQAIKHLQCRSDAISAIISFIFKMTTGRSPDFALFVPSIKSLHDWRFIRFINILKKAGVGSWKFVGGGKLVRWNPDISFSYTREPFHGFEITSEGNIKFISDRTLSIADIFNNGWCISLSGPLKYLMVNSNILPHLPWYFKVNPTENTFPDLSIIEYISPPVTPCKYRQNPTERWVGPSGYSLIDYDHESCNLLISSLLDDKLDTADINYWQTFLKSFPVGSQRVMKNQRFVNGWVENEIHKARQPNHWKNIIPKVKTLSVFKIGVALIELSAVIDYLCAVCWNKSNAIYSIKNDIKKIYFENESLVNTSYINLLSNQLLQRTFLCFDNVGIPRCLYMNIIIPTCFKGQELRLGCKEMSNQTHENLIVLRKALSKAAKIYYSFMAFFFSTVLKADILSMHLLLGDNTSIVFKDLSKSRSKVFRRFTPVIWSK